MRKLTPGHIAPETADEICIAARRLANERLGPSEQLKLEGLARRLMPHAAWLKPLRQFRVGLIGNRTLSFLINPLRAAGLARGLLIDAVEAPYDSAASFALGGANVFGGEKIDAVAVVLDEGAFQRPSRLSNRASEDDAVAGAAQFLTQIAAAARNLTSALPIVATIPPTAPTVGSADVATAGTLSRFLIRVNMEIAFGAERGDWITWDLAGLAAQLGYGNWFDPLRFHEAKTPFRIELCPLVADHLSRIIAALTGKSCRALVLDLDNTLWGGVIGDDGIAGLRLGQNSAEGEAYVAFQRFVLDLRERGVVVAVCSKNTDEIAREPFRSHPEMLLRENHIAVFQANWEDKASNIAAIAASLNLGLESLVFVDDNPAEREIVRRELPLVAVPEVGSDPAYFPSLICSAGVFEHLVLNADDLGRAASYEGNAQRVELQAKVGNYDEYLQSLGMTMELGRFDKVNRARIAQLINKSNQFNLTTRRYSEEDIQRREENREGVLCWQARLSDAFGAHGMIAVVIVHMGPREWHIDTWLQSCRVLARGVEETLMNRLVEHAREAGVQRIIGEYVPTARNAMVADFFPRLGFAPIEGQEDPERKLYMCRPSEFSPLKSFIAV
ncbi:MAG TPA: HAD family hydrolase [Micropepsaceae bacterium]|nr:HAD family hydrolase [Micropepsaceae bacterium]